MLFIWRFETKLLYLNFISLVTYHYWINTFISIILSLNFYYLLCKIYNDYMCTRPPIDYCLKVDWPAVVQILFWCPRVAGRTEVLDWEALIWILVQLTVDGCQFSCVACTTERMQEWRISKLNRKLGNIWTEREEYLNRIWGIFEQNVRNIWKKIV